MFKLKSKSDTETLIDLNGPKSCRRRELRERESVAGERESMRERRESKSGKVSLGK